MSLFLKKGDVFSGCEILTLCGRGAFGVTYLARDPIGRRVAVKIVGPAQRPDSELRGIRNYMPISGSHPNLLKIFHIGEIEGGFFYTMEAADDCGNGEYVPATLGNLMRSGKRFTPEEAVKITRELLTGIQVMHNANLIHRDIKPDNIIFVDGVAKLSDPGLVIAEGEPATFAGTPGFIPPEMLADAAPADKPSDLYAIGKVFYCMITGYSPRRYPELPPDMRVEVARQIFPALSVMCSSDPKRRFQTAADFLARLPETIERPTRRERMLTDFRNWKTLNPGKARAFFAGVAAGVLLAFAAVAGLAAWHVRSVRQDALDRKNIDAFLAVNRERPELIDFQLEVYRPEKLAGYRRLRRALDEARAKNDLRQAAQTCGKLNAFLRDAAGELFPALPAKPGGFGDEFAAVAAVRGFLTTPLAEYLDPARKAARVGELAAREQTLFAGWTGPKCRNWDTFDYYHSPMMFVPPGAVRMRHNGKLVRIPYHFWIGQLETEHGHFSRLLGIAPQKSAAANTPLERAAWNDILFYCFLFTRIMKDAGELPPGYIVRPPNEAEWEYAANNAWLGPDTSPLEKRAVLKSNSDNHTWPPGSKAPSRLGLRDIYGNVAEMVLPVEPIAMQNSVIVRGGSFRTGPEWCSIRIPYLMNQFIPFDIGFRIVIAPGGMDYFDRHFYLSGPVQTRARGKVYELVGGPLSCFDWKSADELCRLLGGRLAEFEDQAHFDFITAQLPLAAGSWTCFIGGKKIDGKWKWIHSGREIDFGKWHPASKRGPDHPYLAMLTKKWKPEADFRGPIFLCEWDEKDFARRNEQQLTGEKLPRELMRFSIGDKTYMLIQTSMLWDTACRFCELLGGRIACPETPELRAELIRRLDKYRKKKILLGGYAKRDQWYWLSGNKCDLELREDKDRPVPSRNRNYVTLREGEFYDSQYSRLLLCEWPNSRPHPRTGDTPQ